MKKLLNIACLCVLLFSCATNQLSEGEEIVEYKDISYTSEDKKQLTEAELREDCDMLKYIVYNSYAGIDEAIENGFDLDATIEEIYNKTLEKKVLGMYNTSDFKSIAREVFSKNLNNTDQHISIENELKNQKKLYYTKIYLNKIDDKYVVCKSEEKSVQEGMEYTGPESNLYEIITAEGPVYRYGLMTNKGIKTAQISLNGQKFSVEAKPDNPIPKKNDWSGLKTTENTVYISLGDCIQSTGIGNSSMLSEYYWTNYLSQVSENTRGKSNIIFDLRSNVGGYREFPAKILRAAYYFENKDEQRSEDIEALMINITGEECKQIISPVTEQRSNISLTKNNSVIFNRYTPELQEFYKAYWKRMKRRPTRLFISLKQFYTELETLPAPDFNGDVYILLNHKSASAAEFGTLMAYELKDQGINVHIVGENSCGAFKYGGMRSYLLKNSSLYLYLGCYFGEPPLIKSLPNWHGEGSGFVPDYWATNDTILNTLVTLTKDQQLLEVLKGLDKGLL